MGVRIPPGLPSSNCQGWVLLQNEDKEIMKKSDQKNKKKTRDRGPSNVVSGSSEAGTLPQEPKEDRNRSAVLPRKETEKRKEEKSLIPKYIGIAGQFLRESRTELRKVKWPTKKELLASTAAVIVLVLVISIYLGFIDFGLIKIIKGIVG
jgi:preprotein translocase subunit SecE